MSTSTVQRSSQRIAILHYTLPPVVGGVESTIGQHARLLAEAGYRVSAIGGRGQAWHSGVGLLILPELDSLHPEVLAVKQELDRGEVSSRFHDLRGRIAGRLRVDLADCGALIAHNVLTLHKNLPLTAALHDLYSEGGSPTMRFVAWHHDLAWCSAQYARDLHAGYPWDLLRVPWKDVVHVTVSQSRRDQLASLYGIARESVRVVPPGVDAAAFWRWTDMTRRTVEACRLWEAELILLLPARITRRKNVQLALRTLACLRSSTGLDARLIVTGPPGAHNPSNTAYLARLQALRAELGLEEAAHFLYELGAGDKTLVPDEATLADLFLLADGLLFPSLEEGFGIPLLEAGLARLPVFCSDIPPLRATGQSDVHYFSSAATPEIVADLIADSLLVDPAFCLRRRVLSGYRWERILRDHLIPLVEERQG